MSFSLLIGLHELGHFIAARVFHIRVSKFSLFLSPFFHLWKYKPKKSYTTFVLGWLPLGGYVKIDGMGERPRGKKKNDPDIFENKPAWQRLIVMLAGVTVNLIVALFIYSMILFTWGEKYIPIDQLKEGFEFNEKAQDYGFRNHDLLYAIDGTVVRDFSTSTSIMNAYRELSEAQTCEVVREGKKVKLTLPGNLNMLEMLEEKPPFMQPYNSCRIARVATNSTAEKLGLKAGDKIVSINGEPIDTWSQYFFERGKLDDIIAYQKKDEPHEPLLLELGVESAGHELRHISTPYNGQPLGITATLPFGEDPQIACTKYGFWESFPKGIAYGWETLTGYTSDLKYLASAKGASSIGSLGTLGSIFPSKWNWHSFWDTTAFLSIILAVMNLLPIPGLDGGHSFFLILEMVRGKRLKEETMHIFNLMGVLLLFSLLFFGIFNDIVRFIL